MSAPIQAVNPLPGHTLDENSCKILRLFSSVLFFGVSVKILSFARYFTHIAVSTTVINDVTN